MTTKNMEKKARQLSNLYYNRGLDKAQIRDLSGAVDLLEQSLKFDKGNIQARNLLGLVYFEMGEAVSALSEWVISKNLQPEDNIATEFIEKLRADQNKLAVINQTIKNYNDALKSCRKGDEDVAAISLRRVISQNPRLIKAYHLLALIYIKEGKYTRARKLLRRAQKIDKTNATTLRFLKEIDEKTGSVTRLDGKSMRSAASDHKIVENVIQTVNVHESPVLISFLNIILGVAVGVLFTWFIILPSQRQAINRKANEKITEYSSKMASQQNTVEELQAQVQNSETTVTTANDQIEQAASQVTSLENLLKTYEAYRDENYSEAADTFKKIDTDTLSADAMIIYETIKNDVQDFLYSKYVDDGKSAYEGGDWQSAIDNLAAARLIEDDDYAVIEYLANAYRLNSDTENAIATYQEIIDKYPDTRRAENAQKYIDELKSGTISTDTSLSEESENSSDYDEDSSDSYNESYDEDYYDSGYDDSDYYEDY